MEWAEFLRGLVFTFVGIVAGLITQDVRAWLRAKTLREAAQAKAILVNCARNHEADSIKLPKP